MDLDRRSFYEKELELRMSMSYGPGRYDRRYEELGLDYPIAYVRWTENRNLQAFLDLAARGSLDPMKLDLESVEFERATETYESLARGERKALAAVFRYAEDVDRSRSWTLAPQGLRRKNSSPRDRSVELGVAFLGAGNYAKAVLLPVLEKTPGVVRRAVVTSTGPSARRTADRFGFSQCGTDPAMILSDDSIDLVFIATRHDSHAALAEAALRAGKAVWLEKPVGLTMDEVESLARTVEDTRGFLMVGYNRRFSSHARAVREAFKKRRGPMAIQYVVAAGPTPAGTWLTDPKVGGGRVIGEACHFIDLCTYLVGQAPLRVQAHALGRDPEADDSTMALLSFPDGSTASISYLANASTELSKERWEAHADGRSAVCDNFRLTTLPGGKRIRGLNQDKGQESAIAGCLRALREDGEAPIPIGELLAVSRISMAWSGVSRASGGTTP
jgi:predicted dehydrogenase